MSQPIIDPSEYKTIDTAPDTDDLFFAAGWFANDAVIDKARKKIYLYSEEPVWIEKLTHHEKASPIHGTRGWDSDKGPFPDRGGLVTHWRPYIKPPAVCKPSDDLLSVDSILKAIRDRYNSEDMSQLADDCFHLKSVIAKFKDPVFKITDLQLIALTVLSSLKNEDFKPAKPGYLGPVESLPMLHLVCKSIDFIVSD